MKSNDKTVFFGENQEKSLEELATERTIVKSAHVKPYGLILTVYAGIDQGFRDSTGQYSIILRKEDIPEFLAQTGFQSVQNIPGKSVVAHYTSRNKEDYAKTHGRDLSARTLHAVSRDSEPARVLLD